MNFTQSAFFVLLAFKKYEIFRSCPGVENVAGHQNYDVLQHALSKR
jgi:hypothetical protein